MFTGKQIESGSVDSNSEINSHKMGTSANSSTEQFNIRWKNYTSVLQSVFRDLLEEERLVDVTLACEGGFIKCHR